MRAVTLTTMRFLALFAVGTACVPLVASPEASDRVVQDRVRRPERPLPALLLVPEFTIAIAEVRYDRYYPGQDVIAGLPRYYGHRFKIFWRRPNLSAGLICDGHADRYDLEWKSTLELEGGTARTVGGPLTVADCSSAGTCVSTVVAPATPGDRVKKWRFQVHGSIPVTLESMGQRIQGHFQTDSAQTPTTSAPAPTPSEPVGIPPGSTIAGQDRRIEIEEARYQGMEGPTHVLRVFYRRPRVECPGLSPAISARIKLQARDQRSQKVSTREADVPIDLDADCSNQDVCASRLTVRGSTRDERPHAWSVALHGRATKTFKGAGHFEPGPDGRRDQR